MDLSKDYNGELVEQARRLRTSVMDLSKKLPRERPRYIQDRLNNCLAQLPDNIERGLTTDKKIERIKSFVRANGELNECKDYLTALSHLRYYKSDGMIDSIDELRRTINSPDIIDPKSVN